MATKRMTKDELLQENAVLREKITQAELDVQQSTEEFVCEREKAEQELKRRRDFDLYERALEDLGVDLHMLRMHSNLHRPVDHARNDALKLRDAIKNVIFGEGVKK